MTDIYSIILPWDNLEITRVALNKYLASTKGKIYIPTAPAINHIDNADIPRWVCMPDSHFLFLASEEMDISLTKFPHNRQQLSVLYCELNDAITFLRQFTDFLQEEGYGGVLLKLRRVKVRGKEDICLEDN